MFVLEVRPLLFFKLDKAVAQLSIEAQTEEAIGELGFEHFIL